MLPALNGNYVWQSQQGMCAHGDTRKLPKGTMGMNSANRIHFQLLKLTCQECSCKQSSQSYFTLLPNHPAPTLWDKALTHDACCISLQLCQYHILPPCEKTKQSNNENTKGSLLWLRYYNSPRLLINRCTFNVFLFLSKLFFHICNISVFWSISYK